MSVADHRKNVDALARALKALTQLKDPSQAQRSAALKKTQAAMKAIDIDGLRHELAEEQSDAERLVSEEVKRRREELLSAARKEDIPSKRFGDYDRIGPFKVSYKGEKVRLEVGSETVIDVAENDGGRLLGVIKEKMAELQREDFSREEIFLWLKDALRMVKLRGLSEDGRVPIRQLYPHVVLSRQGRSDVFLRKPGAKTFVDYPTYQFVYDLARFGLEGWGFQDQLLRTQTPNMATISQGKTMMLPSLESTEGAGHQIAVLWIEKRGE